MLCCTWYGHWDAFHPIPSPDVGTQRGMQWRCDHPKDESRYHEMSVLDTGKLRPVPRSSGLRRQTIASRFRFGHRGAPQLSCADALPSSCFSCCWKGGLLDDPMVIRGAKTDKDVLWYVLSIWTCYGMQIQRATTSFPIAATLGPRYRINKTKAAWRLDLHMHLELKELGQFTLHSLPIGPIGVHGRCPPPNKRSFSAASSSLWRNDRSH